VPHIEVSTFLLRWLLAPIVLLWAYHMVQRRSADTVGPKRLATLLQTTLVLVLWVVAYVFVRYRVDDRWLAAAALAIVGLAVWQRRRLFPYRLRCARCGRPLALQRILFRGSNECETCDPAQERKEPS
jgi:hypothetical protein